MNVAGELQFIAETRSPTSIVCARAHDAAYFRMSCTFAFVEGSACSITEHICILSVCIVSFSLKLLGFRNKLPVFTFDIY